MTETEDMASNAASAQQPKPTRVSLSYEEISKLFSLPIAEAASILGKLLSTCSALLASKAPRINLTYGSQESAQVS